MEKSRKDLALERVNNIKIPADLKDLNIGYIPFGKEVVLQKIKHGERKSSGGLILAESTQASSPVARIVAVGPECSEFIKQGLLVRFNPMMNVEEVVNGINYIFVDEYAIRGAVEDEVNVHFHDKFPTPESIERKEGMERQKVAASITQEKIDEMNNKFDGKKGRKTILISKK